MRIFSNCPLGSPNFFVTFELRSRLTSLPKYPIVSASERTTSIELGWVRTESCWPKSPLFGLGLGWVVRELRNRVFPFFQARGLKSPSTWKPHSLLPFLVMRSHQDSTFSFSSCWSYIEPLLIFLWSPHSFPVRYNPQIVRPGFLLLPYVILQGWFLPECFQYLFLSHLR